MGTVQDGGVANTVHVFSYLKKYQNCFVIDRNGQF